MPAKNMKCASVRVLPGLPKRSPTAKSSKLLGHAVVALGQPLENPQKAALALGIGGEDGGGLRGEGEPVRVPRQML
jgi:hypothetical protein